MQEKMQSMSQMLPMFMNLMKPGEQNGGGNQASLMMNLLSVIS